MGRKTTGFHDLSSCHVTDLGFDRVLAIPTQHVANFVNHRASSCSIAVWRFGYRARQFSKYSVLLF